MHEVTVTVVDENGDHQVEIPNVVIAPPVQNRHDRRKADALARRKKPVKGGKKQK